jgi:hypothetical protein
LRKILDTTASPNSPPLIPAPVGEGRQTPKAGIQQEKMSGEARLMILTGPRLLILSDAAERRRRRRASGRTEEEAFDSNISPGALDPGQRNLSAKSKIWDKLASGMTGL